MAGFKSTVPVQVQRTMRRDQARGITSGKAGKVIPLRYIPLLREERLVNSSVMVQVQMAETVKPLMNAVYATIEAWFIPYAAFQRFEGIDDFNRSYAKVDGVNGPPVDFITPRGWNENDIYKAMGIHFIPGTQNNGVIHEAYNLIINHQRKDRSPNLPQRAQFETTLATCLWQQNRFAPVVPNYDRSLIDGMVPLSGVGDMMVEGVGVRNTGTPQTFTNVFQSDGTTASMEGWQQFDTTGDGKAQFIMEENPEHLGYPNIRVNLGDSNFNISLANIDLARQSAAFEALRKRYEGHDDDEIIELLMEGIRVPEYMERQPMLIASRVTQFGFQTRFATDGPSLDTSVTEGVAAVQMNLNMPRTNTGGIVLITASVVPDQIFERQADRFLQITDQDLWPKYERDTLDVEKVDTVLNSYVDVAHTVPGATFGYEPMNHAYNRDFVRLGGKFYKNAPGGAWNEDRAAIWATEPVDPTLAAEWYLATSINNDPFLDRVADHLEISVVHEANIEGSVVFGPRLLEVAPGNE